jgi:hypothetical protein
MFNVLHKVKEMAAGENYSFCKAVLIHALLLLAKYTP